MAKQLKFGDEARQSLLKGIDTVAKAVVITLGPKGRNIALDKKWGAPNIIHDGVSVAKEIDLPDPFENMGAQLVKEASNKTNDSAGDGTTTATLLAQVITHAGMKNITAGANPMVVKKGIEKAVAEVITELKKIAKPIKNKEEIEQVASISAGDSAIGAKIAEALDKVGRDGVVTVEEGKGLTIDIEYKEGMEFDRGYASAYFVTNPERMEAEIDGAYILLTDKKITSIQELLPFLEKFVKVSKNLVIIADEVEGEALATLVVNKLKGTFNVLAIKAPGFGDRRKEMLEDIAILTGGTVISEDLGKKLDGVEVEDCGRADKVKSDKENTSIIGGKGKKASIEGRIIQIKRELSENTSEFDREKLQERLAKLSGGVAVINVGAATEIEMKDRKERATDAVAATKAALEEGIVPGGAVALLNISQKMNSDKLGKASTDEKIAYDLVKKSLEAPFAKLVENAGVDPGQLLAKAREVASGGMGFDVLTLESIDTAKPIDMVKAGIIDPLKVTRTALENAVSMSAILLTSEVAIAEKPEKAGNNQISQVSGMGGMM